MANDTSLPVIVVGAGKSYPSTYLIIFEVSLTDNSTPIGITGLLTCHALTKVSIENGSI